MIGIFIAGYTVDYQLVVGIYRVVELKENVSLIVVEAGQVLRCERVLEGEKEHTQCRACVQEASKRGPVRIGSSAIGSPRRVCSR